MAKGPKETRIRRCIRAIWRSMETCIVCICLRLRRTMACACGEDRFSRKICEWPPDPLELSSILVYERVLT
jgi:hypothetical protein